MGEGWWEEMVDKAVDTSGHSRRAAHWGGGMYCEETNDTSDHFSNNFKNARSVRCLSYLNQ